MATDYKVNVSQDTKQYRQGLNEAKKQTADFTKNIKQQNTSLSGVNDMLGKASGGLKSFGVSLGAIGWGQAVTGAQQFIKEGIYATQMSDEFDNSIGQAKSTLQSFAAALVDQNWSQFNGGLLEQFNRSKNLKEVLDELADIELGQRVFSSLHQTEFNRLMTVAKDRTQDLTTRQEAYNKALEIQGKITKKNNEAAAAQSQAATEFFYEQTGQKISEAMLKTLLSNSHLIDKFFNGVDTESIQEQLYGNFEDMFQGAKWWDDMLPGDKMKMVYSDLNKYSKGYQKLNDEERVQLEKNITTAQRYYDAVITNEREFNSIKRTIATQEKKEEKTKITSQEKQLKTLKDLQNEYNVLSKKIKNASDPYVIQQLETELKKLDETIKNVELFDLKNQKQTIEAKIQITTDNEVFNKLKNDLIQIETELKNRLGIDLKPIVVPELNINPLMASLNSEMSKIKEQMKNVTSVNEWDQLNDKLKDVEKQQKKVGEAIKSGANIQFVGVDNSKVLSEMQQIVLKNKEIAQAEFENKQQTAEANQMKIQSYSSIQGSLSNIFDMADNREQQLQFAIAQIVAGAQKGIGEAFQTNVWYGIAASAATQASLQTTISSFKKSAKNSFATGGIIQGNSFQNDRIPIYQNQGEAVLTKSDQSRLFNMLDGGGNLSNNYSLEVRGSTLRTVLSNTQNKSKKINYRYD